MEKNKKEKIEASLFLASYFETVGFKNKEWETNYHYIAAGSIKVFMEFYNIMTHHFLVLGGPSNINVTGWNSSDDTIMMISTMKAVLLGGGLENYKKMYLEDREIIVDDIRYPGNVTKYALDLLRKNKFLESDEQQGGNGAAMRTSPIGLVWYTDIEKVIHESIVASRITHNYYIGFLGGMVTALFTAFAMQNMKPWLWPIELVNLYKNKVIQKYYPKEEKSGKDETVGLDIYINNYWKRYIETRLKNIKQKNNNDSFIFPEDRFSYLIRFYPDSRVQNFVGKDFDYKKLKYDWSRMGASGIDSCIFAFDCLLCSMVTPGSLVLDMENIVYSWDTFLTLVAIHPGDNDTTGAIGGAWFGALNGFSGINKERMKELEFYEELKEVSNKSIKMISM